MSSDTIMQRRAILMLLDAASPASLSIETISCGLRVAGFVCDAKFLLSQLDYLAEKSMVKISKSPIGSAHLRVKLSAQGRDYLESGEI